MSKLDKPWSFGDWVTFAVVAVVGVLLSMSFIESPESWWFVPQMLKP